jgi:cytochrome c553
MAKRIPVALATVLVSIFIAFPVVGQAAPVHTLAELGTRLQEAQNDPRQFDVLYKAGGKVAAFCANCHGKGGNSLNPAIPNLAGQNPSYLLEQMRQFSDGERRNEFMQGMIKALSLDEKIGMVLFYSKQEVNHKPSANAALVSQGKDYFSRTCFRCHGNEGRGNETIARIAGQQLIYLNVTLKRYRDGSNLRNNPMMATNTRQMTDADIAAVAAYVSSMK